MRRKWIPTGLAVGLLATAITGGAILASDGDEAGNGAPDAKRVVVEDGDYSVESIENTEVETGNPDGLSVRVAEILGTDTQATHDAMVQADAAAEPNPARSGEGNESEQAADSMTVEAEGPSYLEYGNRVGAILGVDGERAARAIAQAYEEIYAVERDIRDNGSGRDAEGKYDSDKHPAEPADG